MISKRIAVIGANGQVGGQLVHALAPLSHVIAVDRTQLDLENISLIKTFLEKNSPDLIINAAAYTAVDKAESDLDKARIINVDAPASMAEYAKRHHVPFIHYSTDYVFAGDRDKAYTETDTTSPQSVYGATKLQGEQAVTNSGADYLIFRTSWVYGLRGNNFLLSMLRLFAERDELKIVSDQVGAPTSARAIAEATVKIIKNLWADESKTSFADVSGIYHMTAAGQTSWFGFAQAILKHAKERNMDCHLLPISTSEYPTAASRPAYSVLDNHKLSAQFGVSLIDWEHELATVMKKWP